MTQSNQPVVPADQLYQDIRQLIESARAHVVTQVNQALALTYWQIGKTITTEVLNNGRAHYGAATMDLLAEKLVAEYGQGFGRRNLFRMAKFYQQFPDIEIVTTVSAQLSWSHFVEIIKIEDERVFPTQPEIYAPAVSVLVDGAVNWATACCANSLGA